MNFDFHKRIRWVALGLVLVFSATWAFGQGIVTGSISGVALDPQKAVVPNAKVAAKNVATGVELKTTTNNVGYFAFNSVPIGTYTVTIDAASFSKLELSGVNVSSSTNTDMGALALTVGTRAETVTVEATTPLIETTAVQGGGTFEAQKVADLPISNAFDDLAFYVPGVSTVGSQGFSNTNGEAFAVNGQRGRNNNFQIDGQANNDNSIGGPSLFLGNQDVIAEFRIITNDPDVSYGRNSGATVNYVTKSGTNNYHGTAFEYYTGSFAQSLSNSEKNSALGFCLAGQTPAANQCTAPSAPPRYTENRWGGTVGGPIIPNKMWFFGSFMQDTARGSGSLDVSSTLTPTPAGLAMLNAAYPNNPAVQYLNTFGPYAYATGNPHPSGAIAPQNVTDGTTALNNVPFAQVARNSSSPFDDNEAGGRVDIQITPKDMLFGRYYYQRSAFAFGFGDVPSGQWVSVNATGQQIALDWTRTFTAHFVNQARFNYTRSIVPFDGGTNPGCTLGNPHNCPVFVEFGDPNAMSMGLETDAPQGRMINNSQWQDNASLVRGRHTFKFGGEYDRQRSPNIGILGANGDYKFADFNAFLQGSVDSLSLIDGPDKLNFKEQDASVYFSDEWRLRDNLTITAGVRWEYWQQAINLLHQLSVANQLGPTPFWNTALPLSRTTMASVPNDTNNFGPSLGFAWTPRIFKGIFGENKTVIRGGYRISYDPAYYNIFLNAGQSAPVVNSGVIGPAVGIPCTAPCFITSGFTGTQVLAQHIPDVPRGGDPGDRVQTLVSPNFHNPYVQTWTFGIQRELSPKLAVEARYVGSHTVGEFQTLNGNPSLLGIQQFNSDAQALGINVPNFIPSGVTACPTASTNGIPNPGFPFSQVNCNYLHVDLRANTAFSTYHALQTELKVRQWHGVTSGVAYTWSKNMDNASEIFNTGAGGQTIAQAQNPFDYIKGERSLSGLDFPHVISVYMLYETPWFKAQKGLLGHLLGGWQFNTTYRYTSGELWTPRSLNWGFFGDPNNPLVGFGSPYCDWVYAATLPSSYQRCNSFIGNPAAPANTVGQCTDPTLPNCGLVDFNTGAPTTMSAVHWIYNDGNADLFFKTPFGARRNSGVRGDPVNTVNFSLFKNINVSERMKFRLEGQVYNLFNTYYGGVPGTLAERPSSFGNTIFNANGGQDFGSINATGLGVRTMILGAKIIF